MAVVTGLLGIVAEHALPLCEISTIERLLMTCPPAFQRGMEFRTDDAPGHLDSQRTFSIHFWLLNLLTAQEDGEAEGREHTAKDDF